MARRGTRLEMHAAQPRPEYELRVVRVTAGDESLEVWQLPSASTPNLREPRRIAGLQGRNLSLIEHRVAKRLRAANIETAGLKLGDAVRHRVDENLAMMLGLLFRVLAPMRDRDRMRACVDGIEAMAREEAAYWLGMAMHRRNPRRVLTALRYLLTEPKRPGVRA